MARPATVTVGDLLSLLKDGDPVSASDLLHGLGVTRPTLMRLVNEAGGRVFRIGKARSTYYAAAATIEPNHWPLYRQMPSGEIVALGELLALKGDQYAFLTDDARPNLTRSVAVFRGHYPGLPWFLDDIRPQGFLGRAMAHRLGESLGVPVDLLAWQPRDILSGILHGGTGVGDLIVGVQASVAAVAEQDNPPDLVQDCDRQSRYREMAQIALEGEEVGSSPGGEQPKFTSTVSDGQGRYAALVKFALLDNPIGQRRGDLLVCEGLALHKLQLAGFPAANAQLLYGNAHVFLEVERFDRTRDVLGRKGFVSGLALDAAFIGAGTRPWSALAADLLELGLVTRKTAELITRLFWFGRFIGNSDMHLGNIGFHLTDSGPLELCPAYDMLPMYMAPSAQSGNVRPYAPITLPKFVERNGERGAISWAAPVAMRFWEDVSEDRRLPPELHGVAVVNAQLVAQFLARHGGG